MLHYEIHVTVHTNEVEQFQEVCKKIGVKPIILDLQKKSGDVLCEVMTSSTISTEDTTINTAFNAMHDVIAAMAREDFHIIRGKIETVPWHPLAPKEHGGKIHFKGSHFETHFGIIIKEKGDDHRLMDIAKRHNLHLSKNVFKKFEDGSHVQMVTYRSYSMVKEDFELVVDSITREIFDFGLTMEKKPKIEFAIYDSNHSHDDKWLK